MLVGVKTVVDARGALKLPAWANRGLDTDVIVSEVRETSRKPDEVYGMIERMCPGGRKIEIFGRKHNTRPGWLTLGNQLGPDQIYEEDLAARIKAKCVLRCGFHVAACADDDAGIPTALLLSQAVRQCRREALKGYVLHTGLMYRYSVYRVLVQSYL
jgi:hypothetical protein